MLLSKDESQNSSKTPPQENILPKSDDSNTSSAKSSGSSSVVSANIPSTTPNTLKSNDIQISSNFLVQTNSFTSSSGSNSSMLSAQEGPSSNPTSTFKLINFKEAVDSKALIGSTSNNNNNNNGSSTVTKINNLIMPKEYVQFIYVLERSINELAQFFKHWISKKLRF